MKMFNRISIALVVAACVAWFAVPPPRQASAQFVGQQAYGGTSGGIANLLTLTIPNMSSYPVGVPITFKVGTANTSISSMNINAIGAAQILRSSSLGLVSLGGDELKVGAIVTIIYDGSTFQITSPLDTAPIGSTIDMRGGTVAPSGYLIEDGSCYAQAVYPALFSRIGTAYSSCSAGSFGVPDSRGTVFAASDNQGVNGSAGRITNAGSGCTATSIPFSCGAQNKTVTTSFLPASGLSVPALSVPALSVPALSVPALSVPALTVPSLSVTTATANVGRIPLSSGPVSSLQTAGSPTVNITPGNTSGTWSDATSLAASGTTGTGVTGTGSTGTGSTGTGSTGTGSTGTGTTGNMGSGTAMPILNPVLGGIRAIKY